MKNSFYLCRKIRLLKNYQMNHFITSGLLLAIIGILLQETR